MLCPKCHAETTVTDSRTNGQTVRRRRQCIQCKNRYTTYEVPSSAVQQTNISNLVVLDRREAADAIRGAMEIALNQALFKRLDDGLPDNGGCSSGEK